MWILNTFLKNHQKCPPEYDYDDEIDYSLDDKDTAINILNDLGVTSYEDVENRLNQSDMTYQ